MGIVPAAPAARGQRSRVKVQVSEWLESGRKLWGGPRCTRLEGSSAFPPAAVAGVVAGGAVLLLLQAWLGVRLWLPVLGAGLVAMLLKWPEICLLVFLTAGTFKLELASLLRPEVDLTVVLAAVLALGMVVRIPLRGFRDVIPRGRLFVPFSCLALLVLVSSILNSESSYGTAKAMRFVGLTGLALVGGYAVMVDRVRLWRFLAAAGGLGVLMVLAGRVTSAGLTAFNATHIATGRVLGLGLLGALYLLLLIKSGLGRLALLGVVGVLGFGFLYAGSRGSLVALLVSIAAVGASAFGFRRGRRWVVAAAAVLAVAVAVVTFLEPVAAETMNARVVAVLQDAGSVGAAAGRVERAEEALALFRAHPLFGVGIGGFDLARGYGDGLRGDYAHNIVLEVACELGVLGLALLVALVVPAVVEAVRSVARTRSREEFAAAAAVLAVLTYFLVNAMFSGDLNDNRLLFAGLGMGARIGEKANGNPER